jgi:hypothetical protein
MRLFDPKRLAKQLSIAAHGPNQALQARAQIVQARKHLWGTAPRVGS